MSNGYSANHGMTQGRYNANKMIQSDLYFEYESGASTECPKCNTKWRVKANGQYSRLLKVELTFKNYKQTAIPSAGCPHCEGKLFAEKCTEMSEVTIQWHDGDIVEILSIPSGFRPIKKL